MYIKIIVKTYLKLTLNDFSILRTLCTPCIQMRLQSLNPFFLEGRADTDKCIELANWLQRLHLELQKSLLLFLYFIKMTAIYLALI